VCVCLLAWSFPFFLFSFIWFFFILFLVLCIKLGLLHFLFFTLIQCICDQLLYPMGTYFFFLLCLWWRINCFSWHPLECFCIHCERCEVSCFVRTNSCPFIVFPSNFLSMNWHCVICKWHAHFDRCCHCWLHSNWFGSMCCFISQSNYNIGSLSKGRILPWSIINRCDFFPCHKSFWLFTSISEWFFSSMC
jgi:hypothetical protein